MGMESLSPPQATVLAELASYGSSTIVKKSLFGQNDLVALIPQQGRVCNVYHWWTLINCSR